jgi:hypothetical protein
MMKRELVVRAVSEMKSIRLAASLVARYATRAAASGYSSHTERDTDESAQARTSEGLGTYSASLGTGALFNGVQRGQHSRRTTLH